MPRCCRGDAGHPNLYLISVAGYASQDVFAREADAVDKLFADRFGTRGHSIRLINNRKTALESPIASRTALAEAVKRVGAVMDRDEDVLFLFLTSHGSRDQKFAMQFYPLQLADLAPADLRRMMDDAGIRHRVVVVSACYSGGFIDALKDDDTLIITASAPDRNSFGCSNEADFTYFGKAYFDEALRSTDSFIEAFGIAVPAIAARERKEDYEPSNPQIFIGANIAATLEALRRELRSGADANGESAQRAGTRSSLDHGDQASARALVRPPASGGTTRCAAPRASDRRTGRRRACASRPGRGRTRSRGAHWRRSPRNVEP